MTNRLRNAAFLELSAGWACAISSGPGALTVDEAVRGGPGLTVLLGSGPIRTATSARPVVAAGDIIEVSARVSAGTSAAPVPAEVAVVFYAAGEVELSSVPITVLPAPVAMHGEGVLGVRDTLQRAWGRVVAPADAVRAGLAISGSGEVLVQRPFLDVVPAGRARPLAWDPGVHLEPGLQHGVWPQILRPFQATPAGEAQPGRIEFGAGAGRPSSRRIARDPVRRFTGRLRCDAVEAAALETFWREGPSDFWVVDPATDRLCLASFAADGQPRKVEDRGPTSIFEVGLWLETA